jgi:hypothetical protein
LKKANGIMIIFDLTKKENILEFENYIAEIKK